MRSWRPGPRNDNRRSDDGGGGGGGGGGWFPFNNRPHYRDPPPPYSDPDNRKPSAGSSTLNWRPGFWTGLGLGGLAASLWNPRRNEQPRVVPSRLSSWNWDRPTGGWFGGTPGGNPSFTPMTPRGLFGRSGTGQGMTSRQTWSREDREEGSSNLGRIRTATGYGGSTTR